MDVSLESELSAQVTQGAFYDGVDYDLNDQASTLLQLMLSGRLNLFLKLLYTVKACQCLVQNLVQQSYLLAKIGIVDTATFTTHLQQPSVHRLCCSGIRMQGQHAMQHQ